MSCIDVNLSQNPYVEIMKREKMREYKKKNKNFKMNYIDLLIGLRKKSTTPAVNEKKTTVQENLLV
jgi:hypothetical protein